MVVVPNTLSESCETMHRTMSKLQPKLGLELHCSEAQEFLSKLFPQSEKQVRISIKKLVKATTHCQICQGSFDGNPECVISHSIDWDELTYSPKSVRVVCSSCSILCSWQRLMRVYLTENLVDSSKCELSTIVDHFLKVNGHKVSDIALFNAAVSVFASLRVCESQLKLSLNIPETSDVSSLVASLVSHK
jgi:hypothetical protein